MLDEQAIRTNLQTLCDKLNIQGHLFVYLDDKKLKFTGDMSLSALTPILVKALMEKMNK